MPTLNRPRPQWMLLALALAQLMASQSASAQPGPQTAPASQSATAFPGAVGWAATTPGGRGGRILRVTTLAADGPGSFKAALEAKGPRIIVFEVGGIIDMGRQTLKITEPFVTIAVKPPLRRASPSSRQVSTSRPMMSSSATFASVPVWMGNPN